MWPLDLSDMVSSSLGVRPAGPHSRCFELNQCPRLHASIPLFLWRSLTDQNPLGDPRKGWGGGMEGFLEEADSDRSAVKKEEGRMLEAVQQAGGVARFE